MERQLIKPLEENPLTYVAPPTSVDAHTQARPERSHSVSRARARQVAPGRGSAGYPSPSTSALINTVTLVLFAVWGMDGAE